METLGKMKKQVKQADVFAKLRRQHVLVMKTIAHILGEKGYVDTYDFGRMGPNTIWTSIMSVDFIDSTCYECINLMDGNCSKGTEESC